MKSSAPVDPLVALKRLIHADKSFRQIMRLCRFIESANLSEREEAYTPIMVGIYATYTQPFWSNDGLGPLPPHYREFPDQPEYARIHHGLLSGRDWLYGHLEQSAAAVMAGLEGEAKRERTGEMSITMLPGGTVSFAEADPVWTHEELRDIAALCRYQSNRIVPEARALISHLAAGKSYGLGSYTLEAAFASRSAESA